MCGTTTHWTGALRSRSASSSGCAVVAVWQRHASDPHRVLVIENTRDAVLCERVMPGVRPIVERTRINMTTATFSSVTKLTGIAPQFLVDDLPTAITYYQEKLGFDLDFCYESFYASVSRDGFAIHLKCAPKTIADRSHRKQHEHLDVYIGVVGVATLHDELRSRGSAHH